MSEEGSRQYVFKPGAGWAPWLLIVVGVATYTNSLDGPFIFDEAGALGPSLPQRPERLLRRSPIIPPRGVRAAHGSDHFSRIAATSWRMASQSSRPSLPRKSTSCRPPWPACPTVSPLHCGTSPQCHPAVGQAYSSWESCGFFFSLPPPRIRWKKRMILAKKPLRSVFGSHCS